MGKRWDNSRKGKEGGKKKSRSERGKKRSSKVWVSIDRSDKRNGKP
jgi:hypothetical protein